MRAQAEHAHTLCVNLFHLEWKTQTVLPTALRRRVPKMRLSLDSRSHESPAQSVPFCFWEEGDGAKVFK